MGDTHEAVIGKIKALLRLAEDSRARGSLHEAEAAAARAEEMVQKYRLDMAAIEAAGAADGQVASASTEPVEEHAAETFEGTHVVTWRGVLLSTLCDQHGCDTYYKRRWIRPQGKPAYEVVVSIVVGRKSDAEIVRYMHAWLRLEVQKLCDAYVKAELAGYPAGRIKSARHSFCHGAVAGIGDALRRGGEAARQDQIAVAPAAAQAGALVLRARDAEVRTYMKGLGLRGGGGSVSMRDGGAYRAGREAGGRIQTSHRAGLGGGSGRLLGGGS